MVSGLAVEGDVVHNDLDSDEIETIHQHKQLLEMYGFLIQWALSAVETKYAEKPTAPARKGGKSSKSLTESAGDSLSQVQISLETMCKILKLKLSKIFLTTSDRNTFVSLFTRSIYLILESEQRVKNMTIRMYCFKVLCLAVKHHGHAFGKKTYFPHMILY